MNQFIYFMKQIMYKIWSFYSQEFAKIVATRCHIFAAKMTKFDFGWGSAPDPETPLGELTALPRPLAGFKGPYF